MPPKRGASEGTTAKRAAKRAARCAAKGTTKGAAKGARKDAANDNAKAAATAAAKAMLELDALRVGRNAYFHHYRRGRLKDNARWKATLASERDDLGVDGVVQDEKLPSLLNAGLRHYFLLSTAGDRPRDKRRQVGKASLENGQGIDQGHVRKGSRFALLQDSWGWRHGDNLCFRQLQQEPIPNVLDGKKGERETPGIGHGKETTMVSAYIIAYCSSGFDFSDITNWRRDNLIPTRASHRSGL